MKSGTSTHSHIYNNNSSKKDPAIEGKLWSSLLKRRAAIIKALHHSFLTRKMIDDLKSLSAGEENIQATTTTLEAFHTMQ
jgi:hypothetical protein